MSSNDEVRDWRITESWPPTIQHRASCHFDGACVDVNFTDRNDVSSVDILTFIHAAGANNLRAVYEVPNEEERNRLVSVNQSLAQLGRVIVVPGVAPHFSVYQHKGYIGTYSSFVLHWYICHKIIL